MNFVSQMFSFSKNLVRTESFIYYPDMFVIVIVCVHDRTNNDLQYTTDEKKRDSLSVLVYYRTRKLKLQII